MILRAVCVAIVLLALLTVNWFFNRPDANLSEVARSLDSVPCWFELDLQWPEHCYQLTVEDKGAHFELPVVVLPARLDNEQNQALIYLSGGPGGSVFISADDIDYWRGLQDRLALGSDLVLMDRRGAGLSEPLLQCGYASREYRRLLKKNLSSSEENSRLYLAYQWCFKQKLSLSQQPGKIPVSALGTLADAGDIATLPALLGYSGWHLWGVSYGTRLALRVAIDQPEGLRSLVLDSVYPPEHGDKASWPREMEAALTRFFRWCDRQMCIPQGNTEARFQEVLHWLDRTPQTLELPSWYGEAPFKLVVNGQRYMQLVFSAVYDPYLWPVIGRSLFELERKDTGDALHQIAESFVNNAFDPSFSDLVFYAAECKDNDSVTESEVQAAIDISPQYRHYFENLSQADVCSLPVFDQLRGAEAFSLNALSAIAQPVLLIGGDIDPITPVNWLEILHPLLPHWYQATFAEQGHAVVSSSLCAEQLLATFIRSSGQQLANLDENCEKEAPSLDWNQDAVALP